MAISCNGNYPNQAGTGRSHGALEDWLSCASVARWIFHGNGISESKMGFTFGAPAQTGRIDVLVGLDDPEAQSAWCGGPTDEQLVGR